MSDRIHSLIVVLDRDVRDEDTKPLIDAIRLFNGVLSVTANVADHNSFMAEERARHDLGQKLIKIVYPHLGKTP